MKRRPTRPTLAVTDEAVRLIRAGCPLDVVASYLLGARSGDLYEWLTIGAGLHPTRYKIRVPKPYKDFHDRIVKAQAEAELRQVAALEKKGSDRYRMFWLERRAPARWAKTETVEVTAGGSALELAARLRQLRASTPDPRALPEHFEGITPVYSTLDERTSLVTAPPLTGSYLDVTPPESR